MSLNQTLSYAATTAAAMLNVRIKTATLYDAPDYVVKLTHRGKPDRGNKTQHFVLTFGRPNYAERKFIKACQKAGEPFPVKRMQFKYYPKKPTKKKSKG